MFWIFITLFNLSNAIEPSINVLLSKSMSSVLVNGTDLIKELPNNHEPIHYEGQKSIEFDCSLTFSSTSNPRPKLVSTISSQTGIITFNKHKYRGSLKLLATPGRGCDIVNSVPIETYLSTLLSKEMNKSWPLEVLKAQAVAARTYAYHKIQTEEVSKLSGFETYYDIESSEKHQVSGTYFDQSKLTMQAAHETEGEILINNKTSKLVPIFYHSKCGGKTYRPDQVWGNYISGYQNVECHFCRKYGHKPWLHQMDAMEFKSMVDKTLQKYYSDKLKRPYQILKMVPDSLEKSEFRFYENDDLKVVSKAKFRNLLTRTKIPSNNFSVEKVSDQLIFKGTGFGHGVGMCQFGALELAKRGYTYKQILSFYFPGFKLQKAYSK